ncbi:MAG TPA: hypothetical protein DEO60_14595 [Bacteroidales bacterium]|nr:hypothetical protein [Bacteroidales bacterium]HBZ22359.1 hypothetical protein [Bacteroidales bacterium]
MKKYLLVLLLLSGYVLLNGQTQNDSLLRICLQSTGPTAKYLKDFRIQLGQTTVTDALRYKTNMSLWKNTRYRFTMCTDENSMGKLILNIWDNANNVVLSSFDKKTGNIFNYVDLICNKSGIYQIYFDFTEGQAGSGVSIVSMIQ